MYNSLLKLSTKMNIKEIIKKKWKIEKEKKSFIEFLGFSFYEVNLCSYIEG